MKFFTLFILISLLALAQFKEKKEQSKMKASIKSISATSTLKNNNPPNNPQSNSQTSMKKKASFAQTSQDDYKAMCKTRSDCEACALEWECDLEVQNADSVQECYKYCLQTTSDVKFNQRR